MYNITSFEYIDNHKQNTILFLHGWGCNKTYMYPLAHNIKNSNCLLIDLPGFKDNNLFDKPKSFEEIAFIILEFVNKNNFKINYIVGHSFGGKLALFLSLYLKPKHLFLLSASTFNKKRYLNYYLKVWFYKIIKHFKIFQQISIKLGSKDYKELTPIMKKTMSNVINYKMKKTLKQLSVPTTLIYGKNDKITPLYIARKTRKILKDCNIIEINGDHFAYINNCFYIVKIIESVVLYNG